MFIEEEGRRCGSCFCSSAGDRWWYDIALSPLPHESFGENCAFYLSNFRCSTSTTAALRLIHICAISLSRTFGSAVSSNIPN